LLPSISPPAPATLVPSLRGPGRPSEVPRLVMTVVVDPIQRVPRPARLKLGGHVISELLVAVNPSFMNANASTPIVLVARMIRVVAPPSHVDPPSIQGASGFSMTAVSVGSLLSGDTFTSRHGRTPPNALRAAIASSRAVMMMFMSWSSSGFRRAAASGPEGPRLTAADRWRNDITAHRQVSAVQLQPPR
jgi:hypothetical protein